MGHIAEALKKARREHDDSAATGISADRISAADPCARPALDRFSIPEGSAPAEPSADAPPARASAPLRGLNRAAPRVRPVAPASINESRTHRDEIRSTFAPPAGVHGMDASSWNVSDAVVAIRDRNAPVAEQFRAVRTWLLSRVKPADRMCLAVTSSVPREGKTIATANLAAVLAEVRQRRVLAVDCDLRQRTLARAFGIRETPGVVDILAGRARLADALVAMPPGNFTVLPAGRLNDENPTELLNSTAAGHLFDELRDAFDYVVVDTPPVQRVADVGVIGAFCSGVLMVVRMHKTASHLVRESVRWLQSNQLNVLGCIAAGCRRKDAAYGAPIADEKPQPNRAASARPVPRPAGMIPVPPVRL